MPPRTNRPPRSSSLDALFDNRQHIQPKEPTEGPTSQEPYKELANYELPPLVKNTIDAWKDPCQSIGIIAALSTSIATSLLQISADARAEALPIFLCTSIVFNLSATAAAVFCFIILTDFTTRARIIAATEGDSLPRRLLVKGIIHHAYLSENREFEILWKFGLRQSWHTARAVMIICFLCGTTCTFVGLGIWVWNQALRRVAVIVTVVLGLAGGVFGFVLLLLFAGR